jgi:hypothetical protein
MRSRDWSALSRENGPKRPAEPGREAVSTPSIRSFLGRPSTLPFLDRLHQPGRQPEIPKYRRRRVCSTSAFTTDEGALAERAPLRRRENAISFACLGVEPGQMGNTRICRYDEARR